MMIDKRTCKMLGTLAKTHGTDGSLILRLKEAGQAVSGQPAFVFVEVDGLLVPFSVTSLHPHTARDMILTLAEAGTADSARQYTGCSVWVREDDIKSVARQLPKEDLRGYQIVDRQKGPLGTVYDVLDISRNPLLKVAHGQHEYLVPFHQDIVVKIDKRKRTIRVDLPEGLTEI